MAKGSIGILFDENFSPNLVRILRHLGAKGLGTVVDKFGSGAKDVDWIPRAGQLGYVYVTQDRQQLRDDRLAPLLHDAGARAIFLPHRFSKANRWEQALWLLKHWKEIASEANELESGDLSRIHWNGKIVRIGG